MSSCKFSLHFRDNTWFPSSILLWSGKYLISDLGLVVSMQLSFLHLSMVFYFVGYRYCTGGIRCEMASAYIRSKGAGFENVFQVDS